MKKLTDTMWLSLSYMAALGGWAFGERNNPTYRALERRGLVTFCASRTRGCNRWELTEAGRSYLDNPPATHSAKGNNDLYVLHKLAR
jgi:hypothetical protein